MFTVYVLIAALALAVACLLVQVSRARERRLIEARRRRRRAAEEFETCTGRYARLSVPSPRTAVESRREAVGE